MASLFLSVSGAILGLVGIGFLVAARRPDAENTPADWLLIRNLREVLRRPRAIERFVYRHHRLFGSLVTTCGLTLLLFLGTYHHRSAWHVLPGAQLMLIAAWALLVFALIVGIYLLFRPSALKGFESVANRWVEPFTVFSPRLAAAKSKCARLLRATPPVVGVLFLLIGLLCLAAA